MALNDCIAKLRSAGHEVTKSDRKVLRELIADGMTDIEAVTAFRDLTDSKIVSILSRASDKGSGLVKPAGVVGEVRDFMAASLTKLSEERDALGDEKTDLKTAYDALAENMTDFSTILEEDTGVFRTMEEMEDSERLLVLGQMMISTIGGNRRAESLEGGILGISGKFPSEVLASWKEQRDAMLDNRIESTQIDKRIAEINAEINTLFGRIDNAILYQGEDLGDIEADVDSDQGRLANMLGASLYGDQSTMGPVTAKELFQNAFDAVRAAVELGTIEEGLINVKKSEDGRTITITDNGMGMTAETIVNAFLVIGGTKKEGSRNSGGYGVAKMLFLFGGERIQLETTRDGITSRMDVTGKEVMTNAEAKSDGSKEKVPLKITRERTDKPSGTTITVKIPETYVDIDDGGTKDIEGVSLSDINKLVSKQVLDPKIKVTTQDYSFAETSGSGFPADKYTGMARIKFGWGSADILVAKETGFMYPTNTTVSVEGLRQFDMSITENPLKPFAPLIGRHFIIDLHPNMNPGDNGYPLTMNRQGLTDQAKVDVLKLQAILARRHAEDKAVEVSKGYGTIKTLSSASEGSGELFVLAGKPIDITPPIPDQAQGFGIDENQDAAIEIIDGKVFLDGVEQAEQTAEEFGGSTFDMKNLKVDQDSVPSDVPLMHNSMAFKDGTMSYPPAGSIDEQAEAVDIGGKDAIEVINDFFGEDRVNQYFYDVGAAYLKLRNMMAVKGDEGAATGDKKRYEGLASVGVGVSILGSKFYGVHTKVPATMMFINPGADPHDAEGVTPRDAMSEKDYVATIASSMMTTMMHEIAHYSEMNHDTSFLFAMENVMTVALENSEFVEEARQNLIKSLGENLDIFNFISGQYQADSLENTGLSLKDVGQAEEGNGIRDTDNAGERSENEAGQGPVQETDQGISPAEKEQIDASIQTRTRENGIVVPEGSVHPDAGTDIDGVSESRQANLEIFMQDSHVVDENGDPMRVYHGTQGQEGFTEFDPDKGSSWGGWNAVGTWHSSKPIHAERYAELPFDKGAGQMFANYVSIKNPLEGTWEEVVEAMQAALEQNGTDQFDKDSGKVFREHLQGLGYDGLIIRDFEGDGAPMQDMFVPFESNQIKSAIGNEGTFDADNPNILMQGINKFRGSISFDKARRGIINLFTKSDPSTFIHEAGHLYLEIFNNLQQREGIPQQMLDDWQAILDHLGVDSYDQIERKHHELFAKSFEVYTMEGKAPSIALMDAFNSFRTWLLNIYKRNRELDGIELSPEIRGVFDRMLASDEEIALAEMTQEYTAIFTTAEQFPGTPEQFEHYKRGIERAHNEAVSKETVRLLQAMTRDEKAWYQSERVKVEQEVADEAYKMRVYVAMAMLQRGTLPDGSPTPRAPFKLSKEDLIQRFGKDWVKKLPQPWVYSAKGDGVSVDVAALELGYKDGDALIRDLIREPKMKDYIESETNRRMEQKFPDPMNTPEDLHNDAIRQVHNERRAQILAAEMRHIRKLMKEDAGAVSAARKGDAREERESRDANKAQLPKRIELAAIKAAAAEMIGAKQIRNVQPHVYLAAERKASRAAFLAMEKKDYAEAYAQKRAQIVNHEMYRAAVRAKDQSLSIQRYLTKFNGKRIQIKLGRSGQIKKILAIIEGIDFRKISLSQVDREEALARILEQGADGEIIIPPELMPRLLKGLGINWQNLTVQEFAGMRDIVKQLEFEAKREVESIVNGEKVIFDEVVNEIEAELLESNDVVEFGMGADRFRDRAKSGKDQAITSWLGPSILGMVLDNTKDMWGAITRNVMVPMRRAYSERLIPMIHQMQKDVAKLYTSHYSLAELSLLQIKNIHVEAMNETYSKSDLLSLALNWGNEGNRSAVLGGIKKDGTPSGKQAYSEQGVRAMLGQLTERDWAFVQSVWDYVDSYWGQLSAAEQRRRGYVPAKVEASAFQIRTKDGVEMTIRGGYYPLVYDSKKSLNQTPSAKDEMGAYDFTMKMMGNSGFIPISTRAGATYDRVQNHGKVVRLGMNALETHLREIIRDIALGDEVHHLKKLLEDPRIVNAMVSTGNAEALATLKLWLTDAAVGELPAESVYEYGMNWIRTGFVKAKLGWNLVTMFLQVTGVFQQSVIIGPKWMGVGLGKLMQNPTGNWKHVMETSHFMKTRYTLGAWDKDVMDATAWLNGMGGTIPGVGRTAMHGIAYTLMIPIMKAQQMVDITSWLGSYAKAKSQGKGEAEAVLYADAMVEAAQTSGFFSDRSGIERGSLGWKKNKQSQFIRIWTTLIGYMLRKLNIGYMKTKQTNFKSPGEVATWLGNMIMLFTIEGMASMLIYQKLPEDDEPEDWAWWAAGATVDSITSGLPFVREIPNSKFGSGSTPLGSFANDWYKVYEQSTQMAQGGSAGDFDAAARKSFVNALGTTLHLPASQPNRMWDAFEEDGEWYEYIVGPNKDK